LNKENKQLDYDPTAIDYFNNGEFLVLGGSNREVLLYSREGYSMWIMINNIYLGTNLGTIAQMDSWVWVVRAKPASNTIV